MKSTLTALLLVLLAGSTSQASPSSGDTSQGSPVIVRLSVTSGRAYLVTEEGVQSVTQERAIEPFVGSGHLEVAPGSRTTLSWRGIGSMEVVGPTALAWQMPQGKGALNIQFGVLNRVDVEVRSLPFRLQMPGDWRTELTSGAYSIYRTGNGGNEFLHHAGHPVRLSWTGGASITAPVEVYPGSRYRMDVNPKVQVNKPKEVRVPSWGHASWPWGKGSIEGLPDITLEGAPSWGTGHAWPWKREGLDVVPIPQNGGQPTTIESANQAEGVHEPWEKWDWPWESSRGPESISEHEPVQQEPEQQTSDPALAACVDPAQQEDSRRQDLVQPDLLQPELIQQELAAQEFVGPSLSWQDPKPPVDLEQDPEQSAASSASQTDPSQAVDLASPSEDLHAPATEPESRLEMEVQSNLPASSESPGSAQPNGDLQATVLQAQDAAESAAPKVSVPVGAKPVEVQALAADSTLGQDSTPAEDIPSANNSDVPVQTGPKFNPDLWRGLPEDFLVDRGVFRHQTGKHLQVQPNGEGGWLILVDPAATQPYWFFSQRLDVRIFPGATLELDKNGYLGHNTGLVRILSGHSARVF